MRELVLSEALEQLIDHRGKTPKKLGSEFRQQGVPVASAILVQNGQLDLSEARFVDHETFERWMPVHLERGDVILTSEAPLGRVARITSDEPLVLGQRLYGMRGRPGILDSGYLFYALQTDRVQADLVGRSTGTTVFGIRQSALRQVVIPAPEFTEQRAIAEVLGALDDKIAANDRLVTLSGGLADAFLKRALGDSTVPLTSEALVTMGSSPPGTSYNESGDGAPFYQGVRDFGIRFPRKRIWTNSPVRMARVDDTLVSVRAPVGRTNLANEDLCIGRGIASLRSRSGFPMTLFHQVRAARDAWAPYEAEGTVFGSINKKQLEAISLPSIRTDLADQLEQELVNIERRIAAALAENEALAVTRDELLRLLMSGKVRVRDAEEVVSDAV